MSSPCNNSGKKKKGKKKKKHAIEEKKNSLLHAIDIELAGGCGCEPLCSVASAVRRSPFCFDVLS